MGSELRCAVDCGLLYGACLEGTGRHADGCWFRFVCTAAAIFRSGPPSQWMATGSLSGVEVNWHGKWQTAMKCTMHNVEMLSQG